MICALDTHKNELIRGIRKCLKKQAPLYHKKGFFGENSDKKK